VANAANVPEEMHHVFDMASAAGRFTMFPSCASNRDKFIATCRALCRASTQVQVVGQRWFIENPRFSSDHQALRESLEKELRMSHGRAFLGPDSRLDRLDFLWCQSELVGIFRAGVLLLLQTIPAEVEKLFTLCEGPHIASGANDPFRAAYKQARSAAESGAIAMLFRPDEVEVFATGALETLFAIACAKAKHPQ
jgi:hypothetical protein